ncbi:hypothetical protein DY245_07985 [Streptomyces inhibens]|uniref:Uncharacterized protein n=1 Tax=Streptomyces inhibens TaxID=2293571 RepID=A0A371Q7U8_STRIH|nr:hypothetical protein [Streptomyces inhibens]REK90784.1 hypothetical protein DY245_07985 [Streptomyces inhibens]
MTYDPDHPRLPGSPLRLLPWETPSGHPCFLSTDNSGGYLSRKADEMEAEQMRDAAAVIADAEDVLNEPTAGPLTLRVTLKQTTRALVDVVRIADSRGGRLPVAAAPDDSDDEDEDEEE